ncbi:hypothetical protein CDL15_Pgr021983 [Punica granatum]|uniref:Uncharacterized protein n=1 Tax=Punica granatum TaxID=22663 RepID=A0A218WNH3_PUNGR|nr:hypothetical protein CDL15_Pgr021983 [Punica granatum]PKI34402.1 hypothetical protein CRG98_045206 [Punica granatum]
MNGQGTPKAAELALWHYSSLSHRSTERSQYGAPKIPLSAKVNNDASRRISGASLSAPHFGPPASYTRIFDQGPGYYSSPDDQRRTCGHGIMKYGRETWSTEKTGESNQKGKQATNLRATGAGTVTLFIAGSPERQTISNMGL